MGQLNEFFTNVNKFLLNSRNLVVTNYRTMPIDTKDGRRSIKYFRQEHFRPRLRAIKKLPFRHQLTANDTSKTAKITKRYCRGGVTGSFLRVVVSFSLGSVFGTVEYTALYRPQGSTDITSKTTQKITLWIIWN